MGCPLTVGQRFDQASGDREGQYVMPAIVGVGD
jgi:hypothetical protein